jgi:hypothetical protein
MHSSRRRTAVLADVDGPIDLWRGAAGNTGRPVDTRAAVEAPVGRDADALVVAEDDRDLVGSVVAGWDGWRAHLHRLAGSLTGGVTGSAVRCSRLRRSG